ncbi:MAG TPA: CxxC-x17-CxxC domain-containing protein [Candidatus Thermoplasmatota archaeon]|nr:CxxC-x17-CxxC domain-containing protein [Candidatus Thermoplasmatota archaeon]
MGYGDRRGGGGGGGFRSSGPREMHPAKCADCGKDTQVPFRPTEGRPVYCQDCYAKHRPPRF